MKYTFEKRSKIMATLGPASKDEKVLKDMVKRGASVFRINASHSRKEKDIATQVALVRDLSKSSGVPIGVLVDLQGPKIRIGEFEGGEAMLQSDDTFILTTDQVSGNQERATINCEGFLKDIRIKDPIYIDDGNIHLVVAEIKGQEVICNVVRGGRVSNNKGINLPETKLSVSAISKKDSKDILTAIKYKVDFIALSFVSHEDEIYELKDILAEKGASDIKVIAKIERQSAVERIEKIVEASDLIMVARGDLGVEIGVESVPEVQKMIIRTANRYLRPVIVATQMLESMVKQKTPTRAEVSDVANAIYDKCDAVMLSGETAVGVDPGNAVAAMARICVATDKHLATIKREKYQLTKNVFETTSISTTCCKAADQIAEENHAHALMVFTSSGNTPLIASKLNPGIPIIAPADDHAILNRMTIYRGVIPILMPKQFNDIYRWTDMINLAVDQSKKMGLLDKGDIIVVTAGIPIGISGGINSIRILTVE
ncbi:MAG: pyruvate kinase [Candidatus Margulisbacteria bacterium]|nr:pyruvate kinase [Candidatus Margulisiibacteriota bacterium]